MGSWLLVVALGAWGNEAPVAPLGAPVAPREFRDSVAAASLGNDFVVAWRDGRFGQTSTVMLARVLADGGLPDPFGIFGGQFNTTRPSVGTNGAHIVVAWELNETVYWRVLGANGQWESAPKFLGGGRCPQVIFGPGGGAIVFEAGPLVAVRFLGDGMTVLDQTPVAVSSGNVPFGTCARGATDGAVYTRFLIAWHDATGALFSAMLPLATPGADPERRMDVGIPLGGFRIVNIGTDDFLLVSGWSEPPLTSYVAYEVASTGFTEQLLVLPGAAWQGLDLAPCSAGICMLGWATTPVGSLNAVPMSVDAGAVTTWGGLIPTSSYDWALAGDGTDPFLVSWAESGAINTVLTGPAMSLGTPQPLALEAAGSARPSMAANGDMVLLVWLELTATGSIGRGRRFDAQGNSLDVVPLVVGGLASGYSHCEVLSSPNGWVVAFVDANVARTTLVPVALDGTMGVERYAGPVGGDMGYAIHGDEISIAARVPNGSNVWDPELITVARDGGVSERVLQMTAATELFPNVAVSPNGSKLVVWSDFDPSGLSGGVLTGVRVDTNNQPLDDAGVRLSPPGSATAVESELVSDNSDGYLVVWASYAQLWMQHVSRATAVATPPIAVTPTFGAKSVQHRLVEFEGGGLLVYANTSDGGITAQVITVDRGQPTAFEDVAVSPSGFNAWPSVAVSPSAVWFAYSRADTTQNSMQTFVRRYARDPDGAVCEASWQCLSSSCVLKRCVSPPMIDAGTDAGTPGDGGTSIDGGFVLPDGGADEPDAGATPRRRLTVAWGCTQGLGELALAALLFWCRRRVVTARS